MSCCILVCLSLLLNFVVGLWLKFGIYILGKSWLLDNYWMSSFVISRIIKVEIGVISRIRRLNGLIFCVWVTKTEFDNCFIIHWTKWNRSHVLLLHWRQATQSARTWQFFVVAPYSSKNWCNKTVINKVIPFQ